jgi:hypothetical protein
MDPAACTASRQILRWLRDTAREDPSQLPILARDVRDGGPGGWPGPWPTPWAQTAARLLPLGELALVRVPTTPTTAPPTTSPGSSWHFCTDGCSLNTTKPAERPKGPG